MSICAAQTKDEIISHYLSGALFDKNQNTQMGFKLARICIQSLIHMEQYIKDAGGGTIYVAGHDERRHSAYRYVKRYGYIEACDYNPGKFYHKKCHWFKEILP